MKQFKTISNLGAIVALAASAFLSAGCAELPPPADYSDHSSEITVKFKFLDSKNVPIATGSAVLSGDLTCGGEVQDLTDLLSNTDAATGITITAGKYSKTLFLTGAPAPYDTFDPGNVKDPTKPNCTDINCSADITAADGTVHPGVSGTCTIGKSVMTSDGKHIVGNISGTFVLPAAAASDAPTPGDGTASIRELLRHRRNSSGPGSVWERNNTRPVEGYDRGSPGRGGSSSARPDERNS